MFRGKIYVVIQPGLIWAVREGKTGQPDGKKRRNSIAGGPGKLCPVLFPVALIRLAAGLVVSLIFNLVLSLDPGTT